MAEDHEKRGRLGVVWLFVSGAPTADRFVRRDSQGIDGSRFRGPDFSISFGNIFVGSFFLDFDFIPTFISIKAWILEIYTSFLVRI